MKRFFERIGSFFKKIAGKYMGKELDVQHKVVNVLFLVLLFTLPASIIATALIGTELTGVVAEIILFAVVLFFLILINRFPDSQIPIILFCSIVTWIIMPIMFFRSGGAATGMPIWMAFATVLSFLFIKSKFVYAHYGVNTLIFAGCAYIEMKHPEYVHVLSSREDEVSDLIISTVLVTLILACIFKYETYLYEKQKSEIEEQDNKLKGMNADLEKASIAKTEFLANMSHEIRTPINAVLGMDEMILRDCKDEQILSYAKDIDAAGRQLLSIVNDVLDISKIESGKMELCIENFEPFTLINACYNMIVGRAKQKNLLLLVENDPELPRMLKGDEVRIRQILVNFLTNAVKYTEKGSITLKMGFKKIDEDRITLEASVIDTGIGISNADRKKLFGNFNRLNEKSHRNIEGTGLGLAITKQLTELMNGTIGVTSAPGEGSNFFVRIPLEVVSWEKMGAYTLGQEHREENKNSYKESFTAEDASILVVDDVRVNLNVVRLLLRDTKLHVDLAESGEDAIEMMGTKSYDLVLMDHMMPDMDGIETLHRVRSMEGFLNREVKMVAMTANALAGADRMYRGEGFCDYLSKPIKAGELENILIRHLPHEKVNITSK